MIIAVCGGDAAGKQTHTKLLAEKLGGTRFAFPNYDTPCGKAILGHLQKQWSVDERAPWDVFKMDAMVFQALQTCNRFEMLPQLKAALAKGPLILDRFTASGIVYGTLDGLDRAWIELINASLPVPDVWILLDVPVDEGFKRRPERRDRYEQDRGYLEKVRVSYLRLFEEKQAHWKITAGAARYHVVDGMGTVEEVHERIMKVLG